jgi:hypothetical protein
MAPTLTKNVDVHGRPFEINSLNEAQPPALEEVVPRRKSLVIKDQARLFPDLSVSLLVKVFIMNFSGKFMYLPLA